MLFCYRDCVQAVAKPVICCFGLCLSLPSVGSVCQVITSRDEKTVCVEQKLENRELTLTFHEGETTNGKSVAQISFQSWYEEGSVSYTRLNDDGGKLIVVVTEGNTGTGTRQSLLTIIGWRDSTPLISAFESLGYVKQRKSVQTELVVEKSIAKGRNDEILLSLNYTLEVSDKNVEKLGQWRDELTYDPKATQFKVSSRTVAMSSRKATRVISKIDGVRKTLRATQLKSIKDLQADLVEASGVFRILD